MKQNETKKVPKVPDFFECKFCHYITSRKSQYERHILTLKHQHSKDETNMKQKGSEKFQCLVCGLFYNSRTTLWRHKKSCNTNKENEILYKENPDKDLILMLVKQNSELMEVIKNGAHISNTNNSHNNNKTFNLNLFLNETCKDAMNITDFVESIKLQLSDLENVGRLGYVEGISNIITSNLKALDVQKRPIHCTDKKRETLYIKDENKWEKEDDEKIKIRKVIKKVANKNMRLLPIFKEVYPDCSKSNSLYSDQYNKIIIEAMGGHGENEMEKEDKIIKNISNIAIIDKNI